jgi:hypothetical protein
MAKEQERYQRKGFGFVFAILQACLFLWGVPALAHLYLPTILEYKEMLGLSYILTYKSQNNLNQVVITREKKLKLICWLIFYLGGSLAQLNVLGD